MLSENNNFSAQASSNGVPEKSGFFFKTEQPVSERIISPFEPEKNGPEEIPYPANIIITSRYNLVSFIPKSLFDQFRRLANVYFLVLGIIATIGTYTTYFATALDPIGILLPMAIVVAISIAKEGLEDVKRHKQDKKTNSRLTKQVLPNGSVTSITWEEVRVGSVLLMLDNEEFPADVIVLDCGGIQGPTAYVETAAIDGETNLKIRLPSLPREAPTIRASLQDHGKDVLNISEHKDRVEGLERFQLAARCEPPNGSIHQFNGSMEIFDSLDTNNLTNGKGNNFFSFFSL